MNWTDAFRVARRMALLCLLAWGARLASAQERPNVLLCIADDISFPHMGAYGCRWVETPAFDRVAREGLLFSRAYTPNAKCAPSRACLLTGRNSWQLGAACNHVPYFPADATSFVEALDQHGYFVGKTVKGWGPGVAVAADATPRQLAGPSFNARRLDQPPTRDISNSDYAANFVDFLDACPQQQPWCFWYGSIEPHRGFEFRSGALRAGKSVKDIDRVSQFWPDNETVRHDLLDYALEIEHFDQHLQRMLDALQDRGLLENTLVVVTSDNGMAFPRCKGQAYEFSNHMPLAMMWPRGIAQPGRSVEAYVSLIDVAPTVLEIAGIPWTESKMQPITGQSLTDLFAGDDRRRRGRRPVRDHVLIGKERHDVGRENDWGYPIRGIIKSNFLYLENFETDRWPAGNPETGYLNCDGGPTKTEVLQTRSSAALSFLWRACFAKRPAVELYHVGDDPDCMINLAERRSLAPLRASLKEQMWRELREQQDPRVLGRGHVFDEYPYADAATARFHERFMAGEDVRANWVLPSDFDPPPKRPQRP